MNRRTSVLNLPNCLSLLRMVLVPAFVALLLYLPDSMGPSCYLLPAAVFGLAALTDMFDGMIARSRNLITDFGKFLDPLADKFMVFSALVAILVSSRYAGISNLFVWATVIIMLRELGVTSLRLVVASKKVIVAASFFGKAKTCTQIAGVLVILLEPLFGSFGETHILAYIMMAAMVVTTVGSGLDYLRSYIPYLTGEKTDAKTGEAADKKAADKIIEKADES